MSRRSAGSAAEGQVSMLAAMQLLKGSVYESQENWPLAARCYTAALSADALCYEALDRLVNNHMLSTSEQRSLLNELEPKLRGADSEWLLVYYRCKLDSEQGKLLADVYSHQQGDGVDDENSDWRRFVVWCVNWP